MKYLTKIKILAFLTAITSNYSLAQDGAASVSLGVTQEGLGSILSYNYYVDKYHSDFVQGSILITNSKYKYNSDIKIPYNEFTFNIGYFKSVFKNRTEAFKVSVGIGAVGGYEAINNGENELTNGAVLETKSGFIYGAFIGLDTDIYLNDKFSFIVKANEYYHVNSDLGNFIPYAGIGLRIFLDY